MAKKSMINRERKRARMVAKYAERRAEIKKRATDLSLTPQERYEALQMLQSLPRDSSPVRMRSRCRLTGRPRGFYRKFGLGRNKLREATMQGDVPGLVKASW